MKENDIIYLTHHNPTLSASFYIFGQDCICENISLQIAQFVYDYRKKGLDEIINWAGWKRPQYLSMQVRGIKRSIFYHDFKEINRALRVFDFPCEIAPVSNIICEYAETTFYDFLVLNYLKILETFKMD